MLAVSRNGAVRTVWCNRSVSTVASGPVNVSATKTPIRRRAQDGAAPQRDGNAMTDRDPRPLAARDAAHRGQQ